MRKIILRGFSKKFKGTQKLPAQKAPKVKRNAFNVATEDFRNRMGDKPEFMGFSNVAASDLAARSVASKISIRSFDKSLQKALKETRKITATGIKGRKLKVKQPTKPTFAQTKSGVLKGSSLPKSKPKLKIAKGKGELKALATANKKEEQTFERVMQRYTSKTQVSPIKNRTAPTKTSMDYREKAAFRNTQSSWGFDPDAKPDFSSDLMTGTSKTRKSLNMKPKRYIWKKKK
tara:strand:+ start:630 stop:1325 length:696 start_codon:yes stop_codon:yes gene_type:complete